MALLYAHDFAVNRNIDDLTITTSLISSPPTTTEIKDVIVTRLEASIFDTVDLFINGS